VKRTLRVRKMQRILCGSRFDATRSLMEELSREISLCLRYYSSPSAGSGRIACPAGGEANDPQLQSTLNARFPIPQSLAA